MAEEVQSLCEQLVQAVTVIMEPGSPQQHRAEALTFCEEFRERCALCVPCGLQLADKTRPPVIRHFGLQLLEHTVKFRWNDLESWEKVRLKDSVMSLIATGIRLVLEEESHIKDVLARILVEMVKREWPQQWPEMLSELETLTEKGEVQTELVMLVLLRLAEDVVTFQTLPTQRRREIQATMTKNMEQLLTFMLGILGDSVHQYQQLKRHPEQRDKCQGLCRVALATLNTLAGYIDWMSMSHMVAQDRQLLQKLCLLLAEEDLQVEAAECLLIAVSRKGKMEDRAPFLTLFGDNPMDYMMTAARNAHSEGLQEKRYVFLKRLCQVLCALGSQLCALTASPDNKIKVPVTFNKYLKSLLDFTCHPSQFLRSTAMHAWGTLFRHDALSKDPALQAVIPEFLQLSMRNLMREGFPSRSDSPSCEYSRLDYDSDEDFLSAFNFLKAMTGDVIRVVGRLDPQGSFRMATEWLQFQLSSPLDVGPWNYKSGEVLGTQLSPSYIQWEAVTTFCEGVIPQVLRVLPKEELPVSRGLELLQQVINYETKDPRILSCLLTDLSSLFPFVSHMSSLLPTLLSKLFSAVVFDLDNKAPRTRAVKNLRRHACSSIIKICRDSPHLVLPHFEALCAHAAQLLQDERVTQMEKYSMLEAQVLISNHFKDYQKQRAFLEQLLGPAVSLWLTQDMQRAISSPDDFIAFVGADILKGLPEETGPCPANRSKLCFCLYAIEAVLRRARWPSDPQEAEPGGFVVGHSLDGAAIYQNPCSAVVLKVLGSIFCLVRTLNNLHLPDVVQRMGDFYAKCLDMLEMEKKSIMGLTQSFLDTFDAPVYRSTQERMQGFLCSIYESCFQILGNLGPSLLQDFYSFPDLEFHLINCVFSGLGNMPAFRLRAMLRLFVKPFLLSCPPEKYGSVVSPIVVPLLTFLHQKLAQKWLKSGEEDYSEMNSECLEILELELVRLLTRDLVDLIYVCCIARKIPDQSAPKAEEEGVGCTAEAEGDEEMSLDTPLPGSLELTELGKFMMASEEVSTPLLISAFSPLVWMDTPACQKAATQLCWPLLKQVTSGLLPSEAVLCFFTNVLRGLQTHGQHESCSAALVILAFHIYEALRGRYPELQGVMEQIPDIQRDSLQQFDTKLLSLSQKASEKKRRDHFRRLIAGCIGKPLGEQFRKEVHIRNLPSLFRKNPREVPDPILGSCAETLPALFQQ